ncbi:hypothetical protein WJ95_05805 [Burkholderia ubonensis]|uniref:DUF2827 domain-containing protein n=1 Tax=Burkholderia ubonensis TaxID=101571 RepID=UPI000752EAA8|nr:DUF2827 domain-containing protein [Burkholderia ubonensis]KVP93114.1 hypothetical protein WJ95_05805 [Burkholderia ubonensis]
MRIGISVLTHEGQNIWENGLGQNIIFLAEALARLPFVHAVRLIDCGDQGVLPPQVETTSPCLQLVTMREATDLVDVVIEMDGALDTRWLALMRARGKKVVYCCCGQPFVGQAEPSTFGKPAAMPQPDRCDEVWYLPKDAAWAPFLRVLHRCEVYEVPYIWHPRFIEARVREVASITGWQYGYAAGGDVKPNDAKAGARVAIFEPNVSVVKASSIPMLICDQAYRADASVVQAMHVLNTLHMTEHPTMLHLANSLDLVREHKATFHGRHDIVGFMVQHADTVVAHQWDNAQNYSYLDVLYGNYPLIHNSPWLKDVGYYYPDFDIAARAAQLTRAVREHGAQLDAYRAQARRVFDALDPFAQANLDGYAQRLLHLYKHTYAPASGRAA